MSFLAPLTEGLSMLGKLFGGGGGDSAPPASSQEDDVNNSALSTGVEGTMKHTTNISDIIGGGKTSPLKT